MFQREEFGGSPKGGFIDKTIERVPTNNNNIIHCIYVYT